MGHTQTIHVIGFSKEENQLRYECQAMSKLEMIQEKIKMEHLGKPLVGWYAQTRAGSRILNNSHPYENVPDSEINHVKVVTCPVCKGKSLTQTGLVRTYCTICRSSGVTKPGYEKRWQGWQIEDMKLKWA